MRLKIIVYLTLFLIVDHMWNKLILLLEFILLFFNIFLNVYVYQCIINIFLSFSVNRFDLKIYYFLF